MKKHYVQYKMVNGEVYTFEIKQEELITPTKISLTDGKKSFALHGDTLINLSNVISVKFSEHEHIDILAMTPEEQTEWFNG